MRRCDSMQLFVPCTKTSLSFSLIQNIEKCYQYHRRDYLLKKQYFRTLNLNCCLQRFSRILSKILENSLTQNQSLTLNFPRIEVLNRRIIFCDNILTKTLVITGNQTSTLQPEINASVPQNQISTRISGSSPAIHLLKKKLEKTGNTTHRGNIL